MGIYMCVCGVQKKINPHCLSRLIREMNAIGKHPREGGLFSVMRCPEEIAHKHQCMYLASEFSTLCLYINGATSYP